MDEDRAIENPYDVIVVGAGAAGAPLAARLSENPRRRVLLLEAGADHPVDADFPADIRDAALMGAAVSGNPANWDFDAELTDERSTHVPRGRIVGGSTSLNGTYFLRALPTDFARWAAMGNSEWTYEKVLPFYRKMEADLDYGSTDAHGADVHGAGGPMRVRRDSPLHPITNAFFAACAELGFPEQADLNDGGDPGYGPIAFNNVGLVRQNTAMAYLNPVRADRANLSIQGNAFVRRVVFEGTTAVGVEVDIAGERRVVRAREIVLSAGAVNSPHLLLLSGVGPAAELESAGIPVVADLAGVGKEFSDHPAVPIRYRRTPAAAGGAGGMPFQGVLSFTSSESDFPGDLQFICSSKDMPGTDREVALSVHLQQEASRGEISLTSADPEAQPRIRYRYMSDASDLRRMREAVRIGIRLLETAAFGPYVEEITEPARDVREDDATLDRWILDHLDTNIHVSGSCRMGPADDPGAVVDQYGRVRGVTALRVADTSILPDTPSRGTSATTVMLGERMAALIDETTPPGRDERENR